MITARNANILIDAALMAAFLSSMLILTAGCAPEQRTSGEMRRSAKDASAAGAAGDPWAGAPSGPNAIRKTVAAGDVIIVALPDSLSGTPVDRYTLLRAPAMSWLADRSFMWRTHPDDAGRHDVLIRSGSAADTLFMSILVE